jgi:hypothetical protein
MEGRAELIDCPTFLMKANLWVHSPIVLRRSPVLENTAAFLCLIADNHNSARDN